MSTLSPFADPNYPFYIAIMSRTPCLAEGLPGTGKSTVLAALARAMGRRFRALIGSQSSPEDFGGLPVPDMEAKLARLMPMSWVEALLTPGGFLFLDEITAVTPSVRAALLTVLTERHVGDLYLDIDTLMAAACNPPDLCPNGTPLEMACNNRFFHWQWQNNDDAWLDGLADLTWADPAFPQLPDDWQSYIGKWGTRIQMFHRRHDGLRNVPPKDDVTRAYPSQRTWANTIRCLAAADACGADLTTDQSVVRIMTTGNVGQIAADQFCAFNATLDLIDPLELADGKAQFKHRDDRPDITLTVCASLVSAVTSASTFTPGRWDAAAAFLGAIGKDVAPEIALKFTRQMRDSLGRLQYTPNAKALAPLVELAKAMR
jgi:hypothetical protein